MARGFVSGVLLGGGLSLGAAVIAAMLAPPPERPEVTESIPGAIAPPPPGEPAATVEAPAGDTVIGAGDAVPQTPPPDPDTLAGINDNTPPVGPRTEPVEVDNLATPDAVPQAAGVEVATEEPILPNPQALAPMAPPPADQVAIDTESAAPPAPQDATETAETEGDDAPAQQAPSSQVADAAGPDATSSVAPDKEEPPASAATDAGESGTETVADAAPAEPEASGEDSQGTEQPAFPTVPAAESDDVPGEGQETAMLAPSSRPQIGTPATSLTERNTGVVVNRLGLGSDDTDTGTSDAVPATSGDVADPVGDLPPVQLYSRPFNNPEGKPLMSILLIDAGTGPTTGAAGIAALRSFPYPLSFAVDSSLPDAATRMATYREAGFEVLAMIDMPDGAQATDAETTLGSVLPQLNEVIGVLEGPSGGLQGSRAVSDQVTAILAETGHGLVTQNRGLNTMSNLARKEGVPAEPIFRDFDSKDQTPRVIRRFLDQAAFKAGQEGAVIMLGRLRPDTISALLLWGLQDRASSVALVPVSAVLLRDDV